MTSSKRPKNGFSRRIIRFWRRPNGDNNVDEVEEGHRDKELEDVIVVFVSTRLPTTIAPILWVFIIIVVVVDDDEVILYGRCIARRQ